MGRGRRSSDLRSRWPRLKCNRRAIAAKGPTVVMFAPMTTAKEPIRRRFGPLPDLVPVVGQGTWLMGDSRNRGAEIAALRAGIAAGATHIDTAELYGNAEDLVGEAIEGL